MPAADAEQCRTYCCNNNCGYLTFVASCGMSVRSTTEFFPEYFFEHDVKFKHIHTPTSRVWVLACMKRALAASLAQRHCHHIILPFQADICKWWKSTCFNPSKCVRVVCWLTAGERGKLKTQIDHKNKQN